MIFHRFQATVFTAMLLAATVLAQQLPYTIQRPEGSEWEAVSLLLWETKVPGGIVSVRSCEHPGSVALSLPQGMELGRALDEVLALTGGKSRWTLVDGAVNVMPKAGTPPFLSTKIDRLHLDDANTLILALDQIMQVPAVRTALAAMHVSYRFPEIGYTSLRPAGEAPPPQSPLEIRDSTLLDVFNKLAARHGRAAWLYDEFRCAGQPTRLRVDFLGR